MNMMAELSFSRAGTGVVCAGPARTPVTEQSSSGESGGLGGAPGVSVKARDPLCQPSC